MSETTFKLPSRKWYHLEQAVKRIRQLTGEELEIDDLIHFWLVGKIDLATNISFSSFQTITKIGENKPSLIVDELPESEFYIGGNKLPLNDICFCNYISLDMMKSTNHCDFNKSEFMYSRLEIGYNEQITQDEVAFHMHFENKENASKALKGIYVSRENDNIMNFSVTSLKGLVYLALPGNVEQINPKFHHLERQIIFEKQFSSALIGSWFQYDEETKTYIDFFIFTENKFSISLDDLFITESAIDRFINQEGALSISKLEFKPQTKTLNAQSEFIRNLLIAFYDEDTANNIRKELDNPNSEIRRDLETKGLKVPSGKTVDKWINS